MSCFAIFLQTFSGSCVWKSKAQMIPASLLFVINFCSCLRFELFSEPVNNSIRFPVLISGYSLPIFQRAHKIAISTTNRLRPFPIVSAPGCHAYDLHGLPMPRTFDGAIRLPAPTRVSPTKGAKQMQRAYRHDYFLPFFAAFRFGCATLTKTGNFPEIFFVPFLVTNATSWPNQSSVSDDPI